MSDAADLRRVYVVCRPIFSGDNAYIRSEKKVKKWILRNQNWLCPLLQELGEARVIQISRKLLESRAFESELRAKAQFPDLFRTSPLRDVRRQAFEDDAARSTAEILDEIAHQNKEPLVEEEEFSGVDSTVLNDPVVLEEKNRMCLAFQAERLS